MDIWRILKIKATRDRKVIRRAYAERLKHIHPERDLDAFEQLRSAYESALNQIHSQFDPDFRGHKRDPMLDPEAFDNELAKDALQPAEKTPDYYLDKIIDRLDHENIESAIYSLNEVLKESDFNNLQFHKDFEQSLQYALASYVPFPVDLARHAVDFFGWPTESDKALPSHLAAISLMIALDTARRKRAELEKLIQGKKSTDSIVLKALLGPFLPLKFNYMTLKPEIIERVGYWLQTLEEECPELVDLELDQETVQWWKTAINRPHLSHRGILIAGSVSSMFGMVCLGAANIFIPNFDNHPFTLFLLFSVSFVVVLVLSYIMKQLSFRLLEWRPAIRTVCSHIGDVCSDKFKSQVILLPIFIMCFTMILFADGPMLTLFASGGYILLLVIFGISLFFFINFVALFVSLIIQNQPWFSQLSELSKFGLHSMCVLDVALAFFIINFALMLSGGTLRAMLGMKRKPEVEQHLYNFILVTIILVLHAAILGINN